MSNKMNATKLKYAQARAHEMYSLKMAQIQQKYTTQAITLTNDEKLAALKAGNFSVKEKVNRYSSQYLEDFVIFPQESPLERDDAAIMEAGEVLRKKYNTLVDELMLGDNELALRLLREFEKI